MQASNRAVGGAMGVRQRERVAWAVAVAFFLLFVAWVFGRWGGDQAVLAFDDLSLVLAPIAAGVACVWRASRELIPERYAWRLVGAGMISWGLGQTVWSYYEIVRHDEVPFPSAADIGYLALIPLVAAGFLIVHRHEGPLSSLSRVVLDGVVITIALFATSWIIVLGPVYAAGSATPLATVISLAYPLGDVVLLALLFSLASQPHRPLRGPWFLVAAGIALFGIADSGFAVLTTLGEYQTGDWIDAAWLAGFLLVGLATVRPNAMPYERDRSVSYALVQQYTLPYVPIFVAVTAGVAQQLRDGRLEPVVTWCGIILILLATTRQILAHAEIRRLARDLEDTNARLAKRSQRLEAAQTLSTFGSWEWDVATNRVSWSVELYRIFGIRPDGFEASFGAYLDRIHPDDRSRVNNAIMASFRSGQPFEFEHRAVRPGGSIRLLHCRGRVETNPDGSTARMMGTAQDITEAREAEDARLRQVRMEQELEQARQMDTFKTQFMNTAAHELNTPLTPIRIQTHMLQALPDQEVSPKAKHHVEVLERNTERMARLVQDILDATRIQAGRLPLNPTRVDLESIVLEAAETYHAVAAKAGVRFDVATSGPVMIHADPNRVHQVLSNLLSNALKFTPPGGSTRLILTPKDTQAEIEVQDTGRGLPQEGLARLFQPFTQLHDPMEVTETGTGLGLYVCKGLIEAQGGRIWATSAGPGRGASFFFTLPRTG